MKIRQLHIANLGSLYDVQLDDLADLSVFVGKNGSGKTFVFLGLRLLFEEFELVGGDSKVKSDDYLWHKRKREQDIAIQVSIELEDAEFTRLAELCGFSEDELKADLVKSESLLNIKRMLKFDQGWRTSFIELGSKRLVEDDQVDSELPSDPAPKPIDISDWTLHLFDPAASESNVSGHRLLIKGDQKKAFVSDPEFDKLVSTHGLKVSDNLKGQNYAEWAPAQGIEIVDRVPNKSEAPDLQKALRQSKEKPKPPTIAPEFTSAIRSVFRMISVARDSRESSDLRAPLLDQADSEEIKELSVSTEADDDPKWAQFSGDVESSLAKRLYPNPDQPLMEDKGLRLPLPYMGGGEQALIGLDWALMSSHLIYAIEEPEKHLHPDLIRRMFSHFKSRSAETQILLSTHSHFVVDKANPSANWRLYIEGDETIAEHCEDLDDLRSVLIDLGVVPSDILYKDVVVFVEGGTEKLAVFPILAGKMEIDIGGTSNIGLVNVGGEKRTKDNLRIWLEVAPNAPAEYLIVLDSHSAHLVAAIGNEMGIPVERFVILSKYGIEDYYSPKIIVEAYKSLYDLEVESTEFHIRDGESRTKKMEGILKSANKFDPDWKISVGQFVASRMRISQIDEELKGLFAKIDSMRL